MRDLIGKYMFEGMARIPTEVCYAAEFRYANPAIEPGELVIAISQSGETADTLAGIREAKRLGAPVMGIVNAVGSSIARECGQGVFLHAGPEIGVASTKAFTSQVVGARPPCPSSQPHAKHASSGRPHFHRRPPETERAVAGNP